MRKSAFTSSLIVASVLLAVPGCDEKSQTTLKEGVTDAQNRASDTLASGADAAKAAFEDLKKEWAPQLETMNTQLATLKEKAATFKDTQLDGYISQLDAKLGEIKAKLGETFSADGMVALKDNVTKWMGEAKKLYDQASARLAELTKGAAGG
jgi:hypothetical protein